MQGHPRGRALLRVPQRSRIEGCQSVSNFVEVESVYFVEVGSVYVKQRHSGVQALLPKSPWEIRSPQGQDQAQDMRMDASEEHDYGAANSRIFSYVFLVHRASGGWQSVIDLKHLNAHLDAASFRMFMATSCSMSI